jgi:hypothetical protein
MLTPLRWMRRANRIACSTGASSAGVAGRLPAPCSFSHAAGTHAPLRCTTIDAMIPWILSRACCAASAVKPSVAPKNATKIDRSLSAESAARLVTDCCTYERRDLSRYSLCGAFRQLPL